jgi:hypothetical protein
MREFPLRTGEGCARRHALCLRARDIRRHRPNLCSSLADARLSRGQGVPQALDLSPGEDERCPGPFDRDFVWAGIDHEQEVTRLHELIIPHVQFDDVAVDLRCDADEVGPHRGVVCFGVDLPLPDGDDTDHEGASDDEHANHASERLANGGIFSWIHLTHDINP